MFDQRMVSQALDFNESKANASPILTSIGSTVDWTRIRARRDVLLRKSAQGGKESRPRCC